MSDLLSVQPHHVKREEKLYCHQHDPERLAAKNRQWHAERRAKDLKEAAIQKTARRLSKQLGVKAQAYYQQGWKLQDCGYRPALVVSFEDVKQLVERLQQAGVLKAG